MSDGGEVFMFLINGGAGQKHSLQCLSICVVPKKCQGGDTAEIPDVKQ